MSKQKIQESRLRELVALELSDRAISRKLNVSRTAVWHARLRLRLPSGFKKPWKPRSVTVAEYNELAHLVALQLSDAEMAPLLGISPLSVRERRRICHMRSQWTPPKKPVPIPFFQPPPPTSDEWFGMALAGRRFEDRAVIPMGRIRSLPPAYQIETGTTLNQGWAGE